MMFWYDHDMSGWGYAGMAIGMVLFWALLIAGIIALVRFTTAGNPDATPPEQPSAEQLLMARFASGAINETEFREKLAVLRDHARTSPST